jgi:hypothetical protein
MKNALSILILEFFAGCDHHNNTKRNIYQKNAWRRGWTGRIVYYKYKRETTTMFITVVIHLKDNSRWRKLSRFRGPSTKLAKIKFLSYICRFCPNKYFLNLIFIEHYQTIQNKSSLRLVSLFKSIYMLGSQN